MLITTLQYSVQDTSGRIILKWIEEKYTVRRNELVLTGANCGL
jgi:hypothetical protein